MAANTGMDHPITIFLVEDHNIMRHGLASLLKLEQGANIVGEAASGEEAVSKLADMAPPDLVIMDIALPGMNGMQATQKILSHAPGVRVLILSMYNNPTFVQQTLEAGASGYILKESMVDELKSAIDEVMQGRVYISDIIMSAADFVDPRDLLPFQPLTPRETDVFERIAQGMTVKDISKELVVSIYTVYTHVSKIKQKLAIEKTSDMIRYAIENPLILNTKRGDKSTGAKS